MRPPRITAVGGETLVSIARLLTIVPAVWWLGCASFPASPPESQGATKRPVAAMSDSKLPSSPGTVEQSLFGSPTTAARGVSGCVSFCASRAWGGSRWSLPTIHLDQAVADIAVDAFPRDLLLQLPVSVDLDQRSVALQADTGNRAAGGLGLAKRREEKVVLHRAGVGRIAPHPVDLGVAFPARIARRRFVCGGTERSSEEQTGAGDRQERGRQGEKRAHGGGLG